MRQNSWHVAYLPNFYSFGILLANFALKKYLIFSQGYDRLIMYRVIGETLFLFGLVKIINIYKPLHVLRL